VSWWKEGAYSVNGTCFDIGGTTLSGLIAFTKTGDAGNSGSRIGQGNGSIMRLSPVSIRYSHLMRDQAARLGELADESSAVTHAAPECRHGARVLALLLAGLIEGMPREAVLDPSGPILKPLRNDGEIPASIARVVRGSYRENQPPEIRGTGHVVKTLEAALWAFHDAPDYSTAVIKVVNLGEDSDSTGAVTGQLAGAFFGESGIPREWISGLARKEMIEKVLTPLLAPAD
jgi:ADP-ribosylglycohydrolase